MRWGKEGRNEPLHIEMAPPCSGHSCPWGWSSCPWAPWQRVWAAGPGILTGWTGAASCGEQGEHSVCRAPKPDPRTPIPGWAGTARIPRNLWPMCQSKPFRILNLDTSALFMTLLVPTEIQGPQGSPHPLLCPSLVCPSLSISPNCTFPMGALTCLAAGSCWGTCATPCPHRHWLASPLAPCGCWGQSQSCATLGTGPGAHGSLWKAESCN